MEKITKKRFLEILTKNTSVLCGSVFNWNDKKCSMALESIEEIDEKSERRTVSEKRTNHIVFSNGSRLYFDQEGEKEYFTYQNKNGIKFILQKTTGRTRDWNAEDEYWKKYHNYDCGAIYKDQQDYIVYAIIEAEADAERKFYGVDVNKTEKESLCRWLRANGYYYEASGNYDRYHLEIRCSAREAEIINGKLERGRHDEKDEGGNYRLFQRACLSL